MKLITMALLCLLLGATWLQDVGSMSMHVPSSRCCFTFVPRRIPLKSARCYKETSSTCSYKAVVFKMKGGGQICALTTTAWVKSYMQRMKSCLQA